MNNTMPSVIAGQKGKQILDKEKKTIMTTF